MYKFRYVCVPTEVRVSQQRLEEPVCDVFFQSVASQLPPSVSQTSIGSQRLVPSRKRNEGHSEIDKERATLSQPLFVFGL